MVSLDFRGELTGAEVEASDEYGHGTHVASIIAGAAPAVGGRGQRIRRHGAGRALISLKVLGEDGSGYVSDVLEAIEWTIANKDAIQDSRHQHLARSPASGSPIGRPDGQGRRAGRRSRTRRRGVGGQPRQARRRHADRRRDHLAGLHAGRVDGWRAQHARHGGAFGRHSRDVQLARPGGHAGGSCSRGRSSRTSSRRAMRSLRRLSRAARFGEIIRRRRMYGSERRVLHQAVRNQHVGGGCFRRGRSAPPGTAETTAARSEIRTADFRPVHQGIRTHRARRGKRKRRACCALVQGKGKPFSHGTSSVEKKSTLASSTSSTDQSGATE